MHSREEVSKRSFVVPSKTAIVTAADLAQALRIRDNVVAMVDGRQDYVLSHNVDPAFAHADANWAQQPQSAFFHRVSRCDSEAIGKLRALCPVFNGYHLYEMSEAAEWKFPIDLDQYSDDMVSRIIENRNIGYLPHWTTLTNGLPIRCIFSPPWRFGEIGDEIYGVIVNYDTLSYQERINIIYDCGLLAWCDGILRAKGILNILEIGSGYGALAGWFKNALPACSYTLMDLPECLLFSSLYLGLSRPDLHAGWGLESVPFGFRFTPNYMAEQLNDKFDLIINTLSMSEMSSVQVNSYSKLISNQWLSSTGFFFEQNQDNRVLGFINAEDLICQQLPFKKTVRHNANLPLLHGRANLWTLSEAPLRCISDPQPASEQIELPLPAAEQIDLLPLLRGTGIGKRVETYALSSLEPEGHCLYGPYIPLQSGAFVVELRARVKFTTARNDPVLALEVVDSNEGLLAHRRFYSEEVEAGVTLDFTVAPEIAIGGAAPSTFEFRVTHLANSELVIETIELRRAEN